MTRPTILIAALSGRSLAASARRAGYNPLVVDCFSDEDTREISEAAITLKSGMRVGFRKQSLTRALKTLSENASARPAGLVLGTGFEDQPDLINDLAKDFTMLGNSARTVANAKDPAQLLPLLQERGIPHPQTSLTPPTDPTGWLKKRIGGSGGAHITPCLARQPNDRPSKTQSHSYYQHAEIGMPVSLAGVVSLRGLSVGLCRQWLAPTPKRPFRFGGIKAPISLDPDTEARMIDTAVDLTRHLGIKGLVSFDFLITQTDVLFLEVNPRPTAALDILDGPEGHMFKAHIKACRGGDPTDIVAPTTTGARTPRLPDQTRALAYLYADHGPITIPKVQWPAWACDRPSPKTPITSGQPLATVTASAESTAEAENLCRIRLGQLEKLLYGSDKS